MAYPGAVIGDDPPHLDEKSDPPDHDVSRDSCVWHPPGPATHTEFRHHGAAQFPRNERDNGRGGALRVSGEVTSCTKPQCPQGGCWPTL
eukprot:SAG11_NODE_23619_length_385_cov_1.090909_1_plen_88_part_10